MVESNNGHALHGAGVSPRGSNGSWAADMMYRLKDKSVSQLVDIFKEDIGRPEWVAHQRDYFALLHTGLAELLDSVKGKDQDIQQMVAHYTAHVLKAESQLEATTLAATEGSRGLSERPLVPEDRILNALASLLEDAKGKEPSHQLAMANATASITESIRRIRELRQPVEAALGKLPSPITPKPIPGTGGRAPIGVGRR
jgi:hypothetical protein